MKHQIFFVILGFLLLNGSASAQEWSDGKLRLSAVSLDCATAASGTKNHYLGIVAENTGSKTLLVRFVKELHYGNRCLGCNQAEEYVVNLELAPGQKIVGDCANLHKGLRVFHKSEGGSRQVLSKLNFASVEVREKK
jgi:hypothetical protein